MSSSPVIETQALSKVFGPQRALDGVNLQVAPGAIGLLGPNGAGKSTLIKCLLQLQPITSGSAKLLGREVGREGREIRKRVGSPPGASPTPAAEKWGGGEWAGKAAKTPRASATRRNRIATYPAWQAASMSP